MARPIAAHPPRRIARESAPSPASGLFARLRPIGGMRAAVAFIARRRRLRMILLSGVVALALLAGAFVWFRHSPFVSVQRVQITGVHGVDAAAVEAALTQAARGMSTLDVSDGALLAAVAPLRVVREVRAVPSFPHSLRIEVVEQLPVASLDAAGTRTAVAADGVVLGPALLSSSLPSVSASPSPSGDASSSEMDAFAPVSGQRVSGAALLAELTVLGAAPVLLARHAERVFTGASGLTVAMRNGLLVYFGDDTRPHAKWLSLARVLADPSSAGASYIDVRLPSHPAAGFPAGVSPPDASAAAVAGSSEQPGNTESTVASLAAALPSGSTTAASAAEPGASPGASASPSSPATPSSPETSSASQAPAGAAVPAQAGSEASAGAAPGG